MRDLENLKMVNFIVKIENKRSDLDRDSSYFCSNFTKL